MGSTKIQAIDNTIKSHAKTFLSAEIFVFSIAT